MLTFIFQLLHDRIYEHGAIHDCDTYYINSSDRPESKSLHTSAIISHPSSFLANLSNHYPSINIHDIRGTLDYNYPSIIHSNSNNINRNPLLHTATPNQRPLRSQPNKRPHLEQHRRPMTTLFYNSSDPYAWWVGENWSHYMGEIKRTDITKPLEFCHTAMTVLFRECIVDKGYYGGTWVSEQEMYNISDLVYPESPSGSFFPASDTDIKASFAL
ncbi:uncharacterized protein BO80DRAFT_471033 [Aspergillus ibericus CBS 121593]|uniref:Uncharacterized protein n=1 Tax=Aspergillus ibericus CBS 121593 TaxID=1448316 RepID=A0A395HAN1_9EURO|nr:hypothetical protein BO80DRAFT_471033 [Aspergillus ibericus CBS 121593]RAL03254.1 hypothetical protein BO80DRAFT_471033 [Aspergillus ibericus CBS 121593]